MEKWKIIIIGEGGGGELMLCAHASVKTNGYLNCRIDHLSGQKIIIIHWPATKPRREIFLFTNGIQWVQFFSLVEYTMRLNLPKKTHTHLIFNRFSKCAYSLHWSSSNQFLHFYTHFQLLNLFHSIWILLFFFCNSLNVACRLFKWAELIVTSFSLHCVPRE